MRMWLPWLAALLVVLSGAAAHAQSERTAEELSALGRKHYEEGDYVAAARAFEEAYRLDASRAVPMANAGLAWLAAKRHVEAANALHIALEGKLPEAHRTRARSKLDEAARGLAIVEISSPAGATFRVGDVGPRSVPARVYVEPGKHRVVVADEQGERSKQIEARAGDHLRLSFPRPKTARPVPPPEPVAPTVQTVSPLWVIGWTALGVGGAAGAAAIGLSVAARDTNQEYDAGGNTSAELRDRTVRLRDGANAAWFSAAGLVALGAVLLIVDAAIDDAHVGAANLGTGSRPWCIRF